jgi:hypothetical protein
MPSLCKLCTPLSMPSVIARTHLAQVAHEMGRRKSVHADRDALPPFAGRDGVLQMLLWLDMAPETFVPGGVPRRYPTQRFPGSALLRCCGLIRRRSMQPSTSNASNGP